MRKLAIVAAALALSGSAYAADMPLLKAPPMAAAPSWTGWYIGVNGGGVWGRSDPGLALASNAGGGLALGDFGAITALTSAPMNNSGGLAGGQVGYLLQSGSVVGGF